MNPPRRRGRKLPAIARGGEPLQPVRKSRLSDEARRQLLERIADGRLAPSTLLVEVELARQLGVSRTPLHEAMVSLARDGLVESLGQRGWRVASLSASDAAEIYPVLGALAAFALKLAGALVLGSVDRLEHLAALERTSPSAAGRVSAHREWHETILAECPNRVLRQTLQPLWVRVVRYENAAARGGQRPPSELPAAVECLLRIDTEAACKLLERHWLERGRWVVDRLQGAPRSPTSRLHPVSGAA